MIKKTKKETELEQALGESIQDLQRVRADFENYRKRTDDEKGEAKKKGEYSAILKLLPVIDNIERAISHVPKELQDNSWVKGVVTLQKSLEKSLKDLNVVRIDAKKGTVFNPNLHEAIQFDEDNDGDKEVIAEELQAGYLYHNTPIRHAMVKVTRQ
jgi:molecular chaperone GrpE